MDNFIAHILVVDDDDGIRSLVKKYLNDLRELSKKRVIKLDFFKEINKGKDGITSIFKM